MVFFDISTAGPSRSPRDQLRAFSSDSFAIGLTNIDKLLQQVHTTIASSGFNMLRQTAQRLESLS